MHRRNNPNTVNKRQSILLMLALSFVITISSYYLFQNEATKIENQKELTLNAIATLKAEQIEKWYRDEIEDVGIISSNTHLQLLIKNAHNSKNNIDKTLLQNFLYQIIKEHDYADVVITDLNKEVVASTNNQIVTLETFELKQLEIAYNQRRSVSTNLFRSVENGHLYISFISTIKGDDIMPEYAIIFRWNPELFLFPLVKSWPIKSQTSESYIFIAENDSIVYLNTLRHIQNVPLDFKVPISSADHPATKALSGFSGVASGIDYRDQEVFAYVSQIQGTPWYLVSKIDKSELLSELPKLALIIATLALLSILFALLSSFYIYNQRQKKIYKELYAKEKELWQHQEKFKVIMDSVGEGVITVDLDGRIQFLNSRAEDLTGWKLRDAKGRDFHTIYNVKSEETGEVENNIIEKVIKQGIVKELANHTILVTKTGNEIPVMDTGAPMLDSDGKLIGIAIAFQDETERRMQRRLLVESEEKYKSLIETSQDAIFVNHNNKIVYINPAGIRLFAARSADQIIGKSPFDIFHPDYHELIKNRVTKIIVGENVSAIEEKIVDLNGIAIDVEVIAIPFKYIGENAIQVSLRDITDKKRMVDDLIIAKEKAEENNRLKDAFLQNLSHEIRTPMNGIIGFTQLLRTSNNDPETFDQYIAMLESSGSRLINIIDGLVDLSKIAAGIVKLDIERFEIYSLLEELRQIFLKQAEEKGLSFELKNEITPSRTLISSDKTKVYQILSNLINNAIKFTNQGSVWLACKIENESFVFFVKDTGIGIPIEKQDMIFERFIQADTSISRGYEGAGLGLSISKAFVEKLGGKIWVESEYGMGSTFFVSLPCQGDADNLAPKMEKLTLANSSLIVNNLRIMIAEDDIASRQLVEAILKPLSMEILIANNGAEAVKICRENSGIDLILMDLKMPVLDGLSATKEIRSFNKDVIIIAQTAYAFPEDKKNALEIGCNDYIVKPINRFELYKIIRKHLNNNG